MNNTPTIHPLKSLDTAGQERDEQGRFNPFRVDFYRMGMLYSRNVMIMMENHNHEKAATMVLVNRTTGERMVVEFPPSWQ